MADDHAPLLKAHLEAEIQRMTKENDETEQEVQALQALVNTGKETLDEMEDIKTKCPACHLLPGPADRQRNSIRACESRCAYLIKNGRCVHFGKIWRGSQRAGTKV